MRMRRRRRGRRRRRRGRGNGKRRRGQRYHQSTEWHERVCTGAVWEPGERRGGELVGWEVVLYQGVGHGASCLYPFL